MRLSNSILNKINRSFVFGLFVFVFVFWGEGVSFFFLGGGGIFSSKTDVNQDLKKKKIKKTLMTLGFGNK